MTKIQKRTYEKIDEAEIDLVLQCGDSHEFYERYRETFPMRKKGIESISKIWKRRNEFQKKRQITEQPLDSGLSINELSDLISKQNKILAELSAIMNEHLIVSRNILAQFQKGEQIPREPVPKTEDSRTNPDHKNHGKKMVVEKTNDIMIGS